MSRCNFVIPPIPTPPIQIPLGPIATALALLTAIQSALKTLRNLPINPPCPLD